MEILKLCEIRGRMGRAFEAEKMEETMAIDPRVCNLVIMV